MNLTRYEWIEGREMAYQIIKRHPEVFQFVPPLSDILFVMDTETEKASKGSPVLAQVSKIPPKFTEFISAGTKTFMLEWFQMNVGEMDGNQRKLLMAHELKHFGVNKDGECILRGHDFEEFYMISDRFGSRWTNPRAYVEDILDPNFRWGVEGQKQLDFEPPSVASVMDEVADEINSGALDGDGVTVTASVTNGHSRRSEVN